MSEVLDGRRITRALVRFNAMFGALVLLAAIVLFATGRWPGALGALLSTIPIGWCPCDSSEPFATPVPRSLDRAEHG